MEIIRKLKDRAFAYKRFLYNAIDEPAIILLYHRITNLPVDTHQLAVSPDHFYEQVKYLKNNFNLITPSEFIERLKRKEKFLPRTVLLTFDDGYADNFYEAIPILESLNAQAIFYITFSKLNTNEKLWWDELEEIMLSDKTRFHEDEISLTIRDVKYKFPVKNYQNCLDSHNKLHPLIKVNTIIERERILSDLRTQTDSIDSTNRIYKLLTYEELKMMSKSSSCVIGAHTHNHAVLSELTYDEQLEEIGSSKENLEALTNQEIIHFSYPFGTKADYNKESIKICKQLKFDMVCSNYFGQVHRWSDSYQLPRVLVRNWEQNFFESQVKKYFKQ